MRYCYVTANTSGYSLIEKGSELVLFQTKDKALVNQVSKGVSGGCGFRGHTPPFIALGKKGEPIEERNQDTVDE